MQERAKYNEFHPRGSVFANGVFSISMAESDEHSVHKKGPKEYSYVHTFLSSLLFVIVLIVENISHFKLFEGCQASIFFYWLESCVIALIFRFLGRKRIRRYVNYKTRGYILNTFI